MADLVYQRQGLYQRQGHGLIYTTPDHDRILC
jgi:hypothetical protein